MVRILITNCTSTHSLACEDNKGAAAHVIGTVEMLRACLTDTVFTTFVQFSEDFAEKQGIKVIKNNLFRVKTFSIGTILKSWSDLFRCSSWYLLQRHLPSVAKALVNTRELKEYSNADVILNVSMDTYSEDFGLVTVVEHCKDLLLGVLLRKPVVIWAQSVGPFKSRLTSWLVRFTLNRVALITVREEISLGQLQKLGVDIPPIYVSADPAFILQAASEQKAKEILHNESIDPSDRPLIGVTMSWQSIMLEAMKSRYLKFMESTYWTIRILLPERLFQFVVRRLSRFKTLDILNYVKLEEMCEIVTYLAEKLKANVVLIPHDKHPRMDDTVLAQEIIRRLKQTNRVRLITGTYSASELKAVIGQCDLFIGSKMHANIAATSMCVPTIAIQYSHKFDGIMKQLGQEGFICHSFTSREVKSKIDQVWSDKEKIRAELEAKMDIIRERALCNAKLVANLLDLKPANNVSS